MISSAYSAQVAAEPSLLTVSGHSAMASYVDMVLRSLQIPAHIPKHFFAEGIILARPVLHNGKSGLLGNVGKGLSQAQIVL